MALLRITGIGAAPGIGQGRAYIYGAPQVGPPQGTVPAGAEHPLPPILPVGARPAELERLQRAIAAAGEQLDALRARVGDQVGAAEGAVFEAQALFLQDPALLKPLEEAILGAGQPAQHALERVFEAAARDLEALADGYLDARAADLRDVRQRLARLLGAPGPAGLSGLGPETILVAQDLLPSDTVGLQREQVRGIVLAQGAPTAHAAILARGLGLPLVVGAGAAVWQVTAGQSVLLDGTEGTVLVEPDSAERAEYRRRAGALREARALLVAPAHLPPQTRDGHRVGLFANAASPAEARLALEHGAEGLGLVRTEFVLAALQGVDGAQQDEEALAEAYGAILQAMGERPVVVRAMDAGGDKPLPFLDFGQEANPFLGWRGIRVLLDRRDLFAGQTRALLRAASRHASDLRLMFPMVSDLDELTAARRLVQSVCREGGFDLAHPLQIGVMIEVPAAALLADALAREADFFSLGTNDLVQYTLACDRGNARVAPLCRFAHPAVLRLVEMVVRAAHAAGRTVGVCGEAAGDPLALPLLVGLGIDELSVGPARLPEVRHQLRTLHYGQLQRLAAQALAAATPQQVLGLLDAYQVAGAAGG